MHSMLELENLLKMESKDVYLMGDINICLLRFADYAKSNEYLESTFSSSFIPLITKPTRITTHSATLIDHIYTNKLQIDSTSGIVMCDVSDHCGIFTIIKLTHKIKPQRKPPQSYRVYTLENINTFNELLQTLISPTY